MKKRALIAGGAGFIGSHLCEFLLERNYDVLVVDNLVTGRLSNIEGLLASGAIEFIRADITEPLELAGPLDEIYNLASPASPVDFSRIPIEILLTASQGHHNLLELARKHKARILFASSSEVYGDALVHPQVETYFGNVNPNGPRSCYDEAKRFGESLSAAYQRQHPDLHIRIVRIFNTYGPRMRPDDGRIIPNFFLQALQKQSLTIYGDGSQTRSFCYVSDQCAGLHALMQSQETRPVNIGNPIEKTVLEMAHLIRSLAGNREPFRFLPLPENDPKVRKPDITRAHQSLGWKPLVNLDEGLRRCLSYFRHQVFSTPLVEAKTI